MRYLALFCTFLGWFYILFVGTDLGIGVGTAAFCLLLILGTGAVLRQHAIVRGWLAGAEIILITLLALVPAFATNALVLNVCGWSLAGWLLVRGVQASVDQDLPRTPGVFFAALPQFLRALVLRYVEVLRDALRSLSRFLGEDVLRGVALAIFPLIIFHLLFSRVNEDYAAFMSVVIKEIFDPETWRIFIQSLLSGAFFYTFFTSRTSAERVTALLQIERRRALAVMLVPVLVLFGLFALFQLNALIAASGLTVFKALSLYVQRGFWELISAASLGGALWLYVRYGGTDLSTKTSLRALLGVFLLTLLACVVFTLHKLGLLQALYGLKDQRIFATAAALLIGGALVLGGFVLRERLSYERAWRVGTFAYLITVVALGYLNIDLLVTRLHPIHFYVKGESVKDYSYLLGNSVDNLSAWEELMLEGMQRGIPVAEGYYWGNYEPLCRRERETGVARVYLRRQHARLMAAYSASTDHLRDYGRFNLREYAAYHWLLSHAELTKRFFAFVEANCTQGRGDG